MSLIVSWIGKDRYYTSAYIASDSRVTLPNKNHYDACRKVFCSRNYPEIIGYCGDALFPSLILSSLIEIMDSDLLFTKMTPAIIRYKIFQKYLFSEFYKYRNVMGTRCDNFEIIYINKDITDKNYPNFYCHKVRWINGKYFSEQLNLPDKSGLLYVIGSGSKEFNERYKNSEYYPNNGTSRHVFHCFIKTLENAQDKMVGGSPQLVGLYRRPKTNGINFGIIYNNKKYYNGLKLIKSKIKIFKNIEWRNELFERCDGRTGKIINGAHKQPMMVAP
jgi:hypothetical protein